MRRNAELVEERQLLDAAGIEAALVTMAEAVQRRHPDPSVLLLAGIRTGGVFLADRLRNLLEARYGKPVASATLDITLYRDDLFDGLPRPEVGATTLPPSLTRRRVVLVDDVLFTGRTIRSALMELSDFGRPDVVELAVLVDRGHRELPIQPDYVGLKVETQRDQTVRVQFNDQGVGERVFLARRSKA